MDSWERGRGAERWNKWVPKAFRGTMRSEPEEATVRLVGVGEERAEDNLSEGKRGALNQKDQMISSLT